MMGNVMGNFRSGNQKQVLELLVGKPNNIGWYERQDVTTHVILFLDFEIKHISNNFCTTFYQLF